MDFLQRGECSQQTQLLKCFTLSFKKKCFTQNVGASFCLILVFTVSARSPYPSAAPVSSKPQVLELENIGHSVRHSDEVDNSVRGNGGMEGWGLHRDLIILFLLAFPGLWMLPARVASETGSGSTTSPSLVCAALSGPRCCVLWVCMLRRCMAFFTSCRTNTRVSIASDRNK